MSDERNRDRDRRTTSAPIRAKMDEGPGQELTEENVEATTAEATLLADFGPGFIDDEGRLRPPSHVDDDTMPASGLHVRAGALEPAPASSQVRPPPRSRFDTAETALHDPRVDEEAAPTHDTEASGGASSVAAAPVEALDESAHAATWPSLGREEFLRTSLERAATARAPSPKVQSRPSPEEHGAHSWDLGPFEPMAGSGRDPERAVSSPWIPSNISSDGQSAGGARAPRRPEEAPRPMAAPITLDLEAGGGRPTGDLGLPRRTATLFGVHWAVMLWILAVAALVGVALGMSIHRYIQSSGVEVTNLKPQ